MEKKLVSFMNNHAIVVIGSYELGDIIYDDPLCFVDFISQTDYFIDEIIWWERIEIERAEKSIGYGGPLDPSDEKFFFSETDLGMVFKNEYAKSFYKQYLSDIKLLYPKHDLRPSFSIKKKNIESV